MNSSASFFHVYRKHIDHLHDLAIWKWFKNVYISFDLNCICVWCLDNWSRILSSKSLNTFSMARLKTLQFRLTLTPLFTATHAFLFLSFTIFFMICDWGSPSFFCCRIFLYSRDPRCMSLIESPWFVKFSKVILFLSFRLWKRCSKCLPLNCHYHQIGFALKQVVPVSYYSNIVGCNLNLDNCPLQSLRTNNCTMS